MMAQTDWIDRLPRDRLICEFSSWSADLTRLADDLARVGPHVDVLHVDVADGHFAPALLYFPDLVAQLRPLVKAPVHVHLMVTDDILLSQIEQFAEAGSDLISIHLENHDKAQDALDLIDRRGIAAGMVLKIETPLDEVRPGCRACASSRCWEPPSASRAWACTRMPLAASPPRSG